MVGVFQTKWIPQYRFTRKGMVKSFICFYATMSESGNHKSILMLEKRNVYDKRIIGRTMLSKYFIMNFAKAISEYDNVVTPYYTDRWRVLYSRNYQRLVGKEPPADLAFRRFSLESKHTPPINKVIKNDRKQSTTKPAK